MIGKLNGRIDEIFSDHLILDVGGVGYVVTCSPRTLGRIGSKGEFVSLLIDTHVREDAISLYGFSSASEQSWFRLLTSVQGVGAKAGMALLGACPPEQLGIIIASEDKAALTRADGVGPKLAARILTELKDKAGKIAMSVPVPFFPKENGSASVTPEHNSVDQDAISALTNLGYARSDAFAAVMQAKAKSNDNETLETIIRMALKELTA